MKRTLAAMIGGFLGGLVLLASSSGNGQAFSGISLQIQNGGVPVATYGGGQIVFNCSTSVNCSTSGNTVTVTASASGGLPSGAIVMVNSGSCPAGFAEDDTFNALYLLGTQTANADVGTTGGSLSYTPAGTNSAATFSGTPATLQPSFEKVLFCKKT